MLLWRLHLSLVYLALFRVMILVRFHLASCHLCHYCTTKFAGNFGDKDDVCDEEMDYCDDIFSPSVEQVDCTDIDHESNVANILLQGQENIMEDINIEGNEPAVGEINVNKQGQVVVVPQHIHYQFRGNQLHDFCLYDYAGCVIVVKRLVKKHQPIENLRTARAI